MTDLLYREVRDTHDVRLTFANTGCEHHETLEFLHRLEVEMGWPIVWLEAVVDPREGYGVRHKVVSYETASRNGEPFRDAVAKYGIFNATAKACTARLKTDPMESYLRTQGFVRGKGLNYDTAIGIRADEIDRVSVKREKLRFIYPLVDLGITKRDVAIHIKKNWNFDLKIPHDAYGNCTWCWKKSHRKHLTLASECPEVFDFPARMETLYGTHKSERKAAYKGRSFWFRKHKSVSDIMTEAALGEFTPYVDDPNHHGVDFDPDLDTGDGGCGESCEVYPDDYDDEDIIVTDKVALHE